MQTLRLDISTQRRLADETRREWRTHTTAADARGFLNQNQNIAWDRSILVSVVYEAYRLKVQTGEEVDDDAYVRSFPELGDSLRHLIHADHVVRDGLADDVDDDDVWPLAGEVFADFLLVEELGKGAFARAYLALEGSMSDRPVVIKIAREVGDEAGTLAQLRHTNIVPVHSTKRDDVSGFTALCMPFYGRATLHDVVQHMFAGDSQPSSARCLLDLVAELNADHAAAAVTKDAEPILHSGRYEDAVVWMGAELSDALEFAHGHGVYHGDMKPANVLIDRNGHPLVFDFNLAQTDADEGGVGGTLAYMAPEQLALLCDDRETQLSISAASVDVFSLGATLYEALTGQRPFDLHGPLTERNPAVALLEVQRQGPPALTERADVDPTIAAVIQSCLAFNPADRPASAGELAARLRKLLTPAQQARRRLRRHPRVVAAVLGSVCLMVLFIGVWLAIRPPYHERQYQTALTELHAGNYAESLSPARNAHESQPGYTAAHDLQAMAHLWIAEQMRRSDDDGQAQEQYAAAQSSLDIGRSADSSDARRLELMGYCAQRGARLSEAKSSYNAALELGYESPGLRNNLAVLEMNQGKFRSAREHLDAAILEHPELPTVRFNRARLELRQSVQENRAVADQAVEDIDAAIAGMPQPCAEVHMTAAFIHVRRAIPNIPAVIRHLIEAAKCGEAIENLAAGRIAVFALDPEAMRQALAKDPAVRRLNLLKGFREPGVQVKAQVEKRLNGSTLQADALLCPSLKGESETRPVLDITWK